MEVSDHQNAKAEEKDQRLRQDDGEEGGEEHSHEDGSLLGLNHYAQAWPEGLLPGHGSSTKTRVRE